ncbi:MAG: hypothetical protein FD143_850 [Ignavibacteria bacterium]|nr:MAG: hypothetical protein FD143_850 [Ignavibacteria bacterium]KAF0161094.1 MAG: hypothetical protein FD188_1005 [Ignavibacteria bacterium]
MKNRILITIAVVSYLVFYFISPFFHFHQDDHLFGTNQHYHSHLINTGSAAGTDKHAHHSLENKNDHSHKLIINTLITKYSFRTSETLSLAVEYTDYIDSTLENPAKFTNHLFKFSFSKLRWEKYVHTASNVSPPSNFIS